MQFPKYNKKKTIRKNFSLFYLIDMASSQKIYGLDIKKVVVIIVFNLILIIIIIINIYKQNFKFKIFSTFI